MGTSPVAPAGVDPSVALAQAASPASSNPPLAQPINDSSSQPDPQLAQYLAAQESARGKSQPNIAQKIGGFIKEYWVQIALASAVVVGGGFGAKHLWNKYQEKKSIEPSKKKAKVEEPDDDASSSKTKMDVGSGELPGYTDHKKQVKYTKERFEEFLQLKKQEKDLKASYEKLCWDSEKSISEFNSNASVTPLQRDPSSWGPYLSGKFMRGITRVGIRCGQFASAVAPQWAKLGDSRQLTYDALQAWKTAKRKRIDIRLEIEEIRKNWPEAYLTVLNDYGSSVLT